jgi:FtsP/CotA-like multicopper oxidase with cupredoxin domain
MRDTKTTNGWLLHGTAAAIVSLIATGAEAAAPGIEGPSFGLSATAGYTSQPDGTSVYTWGYGCTSGSTPSFLPTTIDGAKCPTMQLPGPTLIATEGQLVHVTLTNNLPKAAGNTSILFPGFTVTATPVAAGSQPTGCSNTSSPAQPGVLTTEVANGCAVTYSFTASKPGTHTYYSGTQGDVQVEMGMYGALIVLPASVPDVCNNTANDAARSAVRASPGGDPAGPQQDFRLAHAAYNHPSACYDREYLFQFSEMDLAIHQQVEVQVQADAAKPASAQCAKPTGCLAVATEPYVATYFMINGRSMPDLMEPNYSLSFPNQPYNGNPHMHPGELTLLRIAGTGRWQHPFHEHGNHVRILARDGNLITTGSNAQCTAAGTPAVCCSGSGTGTCDNKLAGPLLFTTTTTPGLAMDGIFEWTGKGLNWDVFGHATGITSEPCTPDANGYYTSNPAANNYYEWCGDHLKALESKPFGQVGRGGPTTLPDPNIFAFGPWYGGSPYLGPDATARAVGATPVPPSGTVGNAGDEAGFFFMWHSHNEREITTNNAFPGGMLMMMGVDPWVYVIDETK